MKVLKNFLVLGIVLSIVSCNKNIDAEKKNQVKESSNVIGITINDYYVEINPRIDGQWVEPMSMRGDEDNSIAFGEFTGWHIKIGESEIQSNSTVGIKPDNGILKKSEGIKIIFTEEQTGLSYTTYIRYLNQGFPDMITYNNGAEDGFYYFEPTLDWICKMDTNGNIIYYKYAEKNVYDFRRETFADGNSYYCYRETTPITEGAMYMLPTTARAFAKEVIMDEEYNIIKEVRGLVDSDGDIGLPLDNHEFVWLDLNHYICMSYVPKYVDNIPDDVEGKRSYSSRVLATVIQEVQNGRVVFEWDSTNYPELYGLSVEGNRYQNDTKGSQWADYMHCNSIDIDPKDGNLLVSFRNLNSIIKIDRQTGDILWILGGIGDMFGLTDNQKFNRQHFARYTKEGSITLFDNSTNYDVGEGEYYGNGTGVPRGLEFYLDEANKKIISWKSYDYGMPQSEIMGSAQKLSEDKMLLGWGYSIQKPSYAMFSEIDTKNNTILFECSSDTHSNMTYRVYKDVQ